jgi:hypothetical protein
VHSHAPRLFFDLQAAAVMSAAAMGGALPDWRLRCIVHPGSLAYPNVHSGMLWRFRVGDNQGRQNHFAGWMVASLAPGQYSVVLENLITSSIRVGFPAGRTALTLWVHEA